MPYNFPEIKTFLGLYSQENSFTVPDGALEEASNIVLSRDRVLSKRRGFYQYYDAALDTLNALFNYQSRIVAAFDDKLSYFTDTGSSPNLTGTITNLTGATVSITGGRSARPVQTNNNLYITSDNGVLKLEAFDGKVFQAGVPPGIDLAASFVGGSNGPINSETQVAWRVLFGRRDSNSNLLLSSPSDIVSLTNTTTAGTYTSAGSTITVTTTSPHDLVTGWYITVTDGTSATVDGVYVVTVTTPTTFTYVAGGTPSPGTGSLNFVVNFTTRLVFGIPSEINSSTDGFFYQIYRTSKSLSAAATPDSDYKLLTEKLLTAADLTAKAIYYDDSTDDILLGAELYTNPNSREGELQANARPPLCDDVTLFKNHVFYGNCTTRHLIGIQTIDPTQMVSGDYIEVKVDATTRRYVARTGVGNSTVPAESVSGSGTITITYTAHGLVNGDTVYISSVTGGAFAAGTYTVAAAAANTFQVTGSGAATALDFEGVTNGTYPIFTLNLGSSASLRLRETSQGIIKAVNRDSSSLVYGRYTSDLVSTPGQWRLEAKGFTGNISLRANTSTAGSAFSPNFPDSFASGNQVTSTNESQPNVVFISKNGEPEAVPLVNFLPVGARNSALKRIIALRDSVIVLKEDGAFRINGDTVATFSVTPLDNTIFTNEAASADLLNNEVFVLTNQGVCRISDSSVQIVSRKIEDPITAILGSPFLPGNARAVTYESERLYLLSTLEPNGSTNSVVYAYNALNDSWVTWTETFTAAVIGPNDTLYMVSTANKIKKERKNHNKIDMSNQNYAVNVTSVATDAKSAVITISGYTPVVGDMIVKSDVINLISAVTGAASPYTVTFTRQSNLIAADAVILYQAIESVVKMAPFHAGLVGRMKQFAQMQIHVRDSNLSSAMLSYGGDTVGSSVVTDWSAAAFGQTSATGWGIEPWGLFPWGNPNGINNTYGTRNAPILRTYVPLSQQRNTFIQARLVHRNAGESMDIQSLSFAVRSYGERVSR